ncbi:flagellar basal body protein [Aliifodinibius sp. S!AR15-10]|uniref:flagellar basal body rod protein FlgC n=1 Tax=Aliifodinibius sp. S!AR15-10 TaxID=2950437 RepID=UPI00285480D7|nr:flagellar basal body rod C-terminal domain-containing protein [Aliifodinibius sp. S!AR15-10]MDR8394259.1 flagellar basal body protein [Aliifodinibius sp. S!AR15-10]
MLPDRLFSTFQTAAQGLDAQRQKISVASRNIANANTSAPPGSANIYRPQSVAMRTPSTEKFEQLLSNSISSLRQTDPKHLSGARGGGQPDDPVQQGMGPRTEVKETQSFRYEYDPNHPDANEKGMVRYPDVDLLKQMTQMLSANKLYEANLSSIEAEKKIIKRSLQI